MQVTDPLTLSGDMLDGAKSYLRIDGDDEDEALGAIILAAIAQAEAFCGQIILRRTVRETIIANRQWQILASAPVASVDGATGIPAEGARFTFASDAWDAKLSSRGEAYVRIQRPGIAGRAEITLIVGIAAEWAELHEGLRLALLRLTAYLYANRDAADGAGLPASVTALLRPWRRARL